MGEFKRIVITSICSVLGGVIQCSITGDYEAGSALAFILSLLVTFMG